MKRPISIVLALSLTAGLGALAPATAEEPTGDAKSAILLIGDGMSLAQVYSAQIFAEEVLGESLVIPTIADTAVTRTHSADSMVTDSAAAGTAIHSGYKANNWFTVGTGSGMPPGLASRPTPWSTPITVNRVEPTTMLSPAFLVSTSMSGTSCPPAPEAPEAPAVD